MRDYPKGIKRALRDWTAEAHERELHRELIELDRSFDAWRAGKLDSGMLSERIHQFHQGPARELWKRYNGGFEDMNVASALTVGILNYEEVPTEVVEAIQPLMTFIGPPSDEATA